MVVGSLVVAAGISYANKCSTLRFICGYWMVELWLGQKMSFENKYPQMILFN